VACTNDELEILTFIARASGGMNGKMHGNPAKQLKAVCMAQFAPMPKNKNMTARKIVSYTLCLDFRIFSERAEVPHMRDSCFILCFFLIKEKEKL
jgi:hypothetical protein